MVWHMMVGRKAATHTYTLIVPLWLQILLRLLLWDDRQSTLLLLQCHGARHCAVTQGRDLTSLHPSLHATLVPQVTMHCWS